MPDGTSGECAMVVNDNGEYKIDAADCSSTGPFVCEITVSTACNQWVDLDAHIAVIDQEPNDQGPDQNLTDISTDGLSWTSCSDVGDPF